MKKDHSNCIRIFFWPIPIQFELLLLFELPTGYGPENNVDNIFIYQYTCIFGNNVSRDTSHIPTCDGSNFDPTRRIVTGDEKLPNKVIKHIALPLTQL